MAMKWRRGVPRLYWLYSAGGSTVPLIHKVKPLTTGEPGVLLSIVNFYFCIEEDLPGVNSHPCRGFLISESLALLWEWCSWRLWRVQLIQLYLSTLSELHSHEWELVTSIPAAQRHFAGTLPLVIQTHWCLHWSAAGWHGKWTHSNSILCNLFFISVLENWWPSRIPAEKKSVTIFTVKKKKYFLHFWFYPIISKQSSN